MFPFLRFCQPISDYGDTFFVKAATERQRKLRDASGSKSRREPYEIGRDEIATVGTASATLSVAGPALFGWHSGSLASLFNRFAAENEPAKEQHIGKNQQRGYRGYGIADLMA